MDQLFVQTSFLKDLNSHKFSGRDLLMQIYSPATGIDHPFRDATRTFLEFCQKLPSGASDQKIDSIKYSLNRDMPIVSVSRNLPQANKKYTKTLNGNFFLAGMISSMYVTYGEGWMQDNINPLDSVSINYVYYAGDQPKKLIFETSVAEIKNLANAIMPQIQYQTRPDVQSSSRLQIDLYPEQVGESVKPARRPLADLIVDPNFHSGDILGEVYDREKGLLTDRAQEFNRLCLVMPKQLKQNIVIRAAGLGTYSDGFSVNSFGAEHLHDFMFDLDQYGVKSPISSARARKMLAGLVSAMYTVEGTHWLQPDYPNSDIIFPYLHEYKGKRKVDFFQMQRNDAAILMQNIFFLYKISPTIAKGA